MASKPSLHRVWDALTGQQKSVLEEHTESVYSVAISPDGKTIVSGSYDNTVR
jgi:WD40 repeat protein